jgi:hypothetical protein
MHHTAQTSTPKHMVRSHTTSTCCVKLRDYVKRNMLTARENGRFQVEGLYIKRRVASYTGLFSRR